MIVEDLFRIIIILFIVSKCLIMWMNGWTLFLGLYIFIMFIKSIMCGGWILLYNVYVYKVNLYYNVSN